MRVDSLGAGWAGVSYEHNYNSEDPWWSSCLSMVVSCVYGQFNGKVNNGWVYGLVFCRVYCQVYGQIYSQVYGQVYGWIYFQDYGQVSVCMVRFWLNPWSSLWISLAMTEEKDRQCLRE